MLFQSTLPVGGATFIGIEVKCPGKISIHAPRGGSDFKPERMFIYGNDFNPRSPWGERRRDFSLPIRERRFQSTLPVGGATAEMQERAAKLQISIHAPRGGSDSSDTGKSVVNLGFQSTLPVGGATLVLPS